ncbi:transposase [Streptomyces sp. NPDC050516]|uniref:transposase n=1 Tax=Streptomyces sp. NPDC050516 TaxID=3365621 RepID=UPI0037A77920
MSKKSSTGKRYTDEYKKDAVELVLSSGRTVTDVARGLGRERRGPAGLGEAGEGRPGRGARRRADHG